MNKYNYRARDQQGQEVEGMKEANDQYELARVLRQDGYLLLSAQDLSLSAKKSVGEQAKMLTKSIKLFNRVKLPERIMFSKNLGVMIGAGLPLTRALEALSRESRNEFFKSIIADVVDQVRQGHTLTESLARNPKVFPPLYTTMVEAGEKSGKLQESLAVLASQMQADYDLIRKVRGAVIYPSVVLTAMFGVGVFMMIYVVPTLTQVFRELNVDLPVTTQFIIGLSESITNYGLFLLVGLIVVAVIIIRARRIVAVKHLVDSMIIRTPLLGPLAKSFNAARTARTLSSLLSAGVQILEALDITSRVVQNHLYGQILQEARIGVQKGDTISKVFLKHEDLYPSLVGEMLSVGEETGESSKMLTEVAVFYENQVADATRDLSTIVEPVLMIIIGIGVGFFAVSMIQPMYSISTAIE